MRFKDKVALISAAANGIGRATATIMAREGATVIAVDNHQGRLDEAVPALRQAGGKAGGKVEGKLVDALDAAQVDRLVAEVERDHGRIDILVNAVGGSTVIANPQATTEELTFADWQKLIAFNLDGTFLFTHAVIPVMKRRRSGKIVNLASIAGRGLSANSSSAYAAAKGGIIAFTRKLAHELGPDGINVNAIAPSITLTERIRPHWEKRSQGSQAEEIERTPLRRVAEAVDQANVICFLASADADFVTGLTIDVRVGVSRPPRDVPKGQGVFCRLRLKSSNLLAFLRPLAGTERRRRTAWPARSDSSGSAPWAGRWRSTWRRPVSRWWCTTSTRRRPSRLKPKAPKWPTRRKRWRRQWSAPSSSSRPPSRPNR